MPIRSCLRAVTLPLWIGLALCVSDRVANAQKFYPDDPLRAEPPPVPVINPQPRALSEILELFNNTVNRPGERHPSSGVIAAGGMNTLGEVLDSDWFINRHATRRLTPEELVRGPGTDHAPALDGRWRVLTLRPHGIRPGILVADARGRLYLLQFDPPGHPEMSTGSQIVSSRFAHAIGYFVPEYYLVRVERAALELGDGAEIVSSAGNRRQLTDIDLDVFLRGVARIGSGQYPAVALYIAPEWRADLGPFQLFTTRSDDPNDIVPHEHRRDLRGLFVISAWLNQSTMRALSTVDALVEVDGIPRVRHFLVDFFATLGSGSNEAKRAWEGNGPLFDSGDVFRNALGLGIWSPAWMRERFPGVPAVGRFAAAAFDPERWSPTERLAAFENRLPDDEYWGAKQVAAFTDDDIATIVGSGGYTDPAAVAWITNTLIERRNRIAQTYFRKVLPLDNFRVEGGTLRFDDLAVAHGVADGPANYTARWLRLDNATGHVTPLGGAASFAVPRDVSEARDGSYFAVRIESSRRSPEMHVMVYLRTRGGGQDIVGVERGWPGKVIVDPRDIDVAVTRFDGLTPEQKRLYEPHARRDAAARGLTMTVAEHFDSQTISARTTFDSVTHALLNSKLTDASGKDLGTSFDLLAGLDRIAGQYHGRRGDEQFRLFVELEPDAVEILGQSQEFFRDRDNTVFHVGYPLSFRQVGRVPNIQFSVSEDGQRADIDVDYRASGIPRGLFNGHLSASNSDVRAGNNLDRHNGRWAGFVAWWRAVFGEVPEDQPLSGSSVDIAHAEVPTPLPPNRSSDAPITEPQDAVQEFLTDWLIRRDVDEALGAVSPGLFACVNVDDDRENEALAGDQARRVLLDTMRYALDEMKGLRNLTEAIAALEVTTDTERLVPHAFDREFTLMRLSPDLAMADFLVCDAGALPVTTSSTTPYYAALLRFRRPDAAVLGLLWAEEEGRWRLKSYRTFAM
jgi:hypothetical protein